MLKGKQLFKKSIAIVSALAAFSPIAASAAALDTTTYTGEQAYQGFTTDYKFLDTFDTYYKCTKQAEFGYVPIYGFNSTTDGTTGTPVTGGLGKASDDNYYKLTTGNAASPSAEIVYGGKGAFNFADTNKDMYFTIDFYNPSNGGGQVQFRPSFGAYDDYNYFNADGTILYSYTGNTVCGKYELDKWNTVTMRVSNGDGSTKKYTMEMYINGEFVYRRAFVKDSDMTRGFGGFRFTVNSKNSTAYFDNAGIGLVSDNKTTGSFVEVPAFTAGNGNFTIDADTKTVTYKKGFGLTFTDLKNALTKSEDYTAVTLLDASGKAISNDSLDNSSAAKIRFANGDYTRTYTLSGVESADDKVWLNVDFDDDETEVLSSINDSEVKKALVTAVGKGNVGTVGENNQLKGKDAPAAYGAEIVSGAVGRNAGDNSLKLTLPTGGSQLNFEWNYNNYSVISTSDSQFVMEFSVMLPSSSNGVVISPAMFTSKKEAGITDGSQRVWGISGDIIKDNALQMDKKPSIANKWTKLTYHITKFAEVKDGAITENSGTYDIYVNGEKVGTKTHSMPNVSGIQLKMVANKKGSDTAVIYIDDFKAYTVKDKTPYFADKNTAKNPAYNSSATGYRFGNGLVYADTAETVSAAKNAFGIQSVLNADGSAKADTKNIAFGDTVTLKSADGNIIYYYTLHEGNIYLVQNSKITKEGDTYTYGDRVANGTGKDIYFRGYLAAFDSDGRLIGCAQIPNNNNRMGCSSAGGTSFGMKGTFKDAAKVYAYVWNDDTLEPLVNVVEYTP